MNRDELDVVAKADEQFDPTEFLTADKYQPMIEDNEFAILVPKTRMEYILAQEVQIIQIFSKYNLELAMNVPKQMVYVKTTSRTADPTTALIARQMLKLVARFMDLDVASKVFKQGIESEIIPVDLCNKQETFLKRRLRFVGDNRQTLTAIELLTNTQLCVYGSTVCVVGPPAGIALIQRICSDVFGKNVLPSFWIKTLMVRRELEKVPELADQDWSSFMPQLKRSKSRRKAVEIKHKAPLEERGIPDVSKQCERQVDKLLRSGEGGYKQQKVMKK